MKRTNSYLLLTLLLGMVGAKALAYDAFINGIYYNYSGTDAIVISGTYKYSGDVSIPPAVNDNGTTCSPLPRGVSCSACRRSVQIPSTQYRS